MPDVYDYPRTIDREYIRQSQYPRSVLFESAPHLGNNAEISNQVSLPSAYVIRETTIPCLYQSRYGLDRIRFLLAAHDIECNFINADHKPVSSAKRVVNHH